MAQKYFAYLTTRGEAKLAQATALGIQLKLTQMGVGDGGGTLPTPSPSQTRLINEKRRAGLNSLTVDEQNPGQLIAEQIIPENEGGWWIREIGLYDDTNELIAIANCAETYKPLLAEGSGRTQAIRMVLIVSSTDAVTLKIDPSVILATRKYVDDTAIVVKAYVDDVMKKHLDNADPHPQYATKNSPEFSGTPTTPTAPSADNSMQLANTAFVKAAIAALVDSAPVSLDTLKELAAALGNDQNFSTTVLNALAGKQAADATLTALAGLLTGANKLPYFTGTDQAALTDLTQVGRDIIGKADIQTLITYLGVDDAIHGDWANIAGFLSGDSDKPYIRHTGKKADIQLATAAQMSDKQPKDDTLTALAALVGAANKLPYFNGDETAALTSLTQTGRDIIGKDTVAEVRQYLELKTAALREVGVAANQIPDMGAFASSGTVSGYQKLPSGLIIQWGRANIPTGGIFVNYPIPFPSSTYVVLLGSVGATATNITANNYLNNGFSFNASAQTVVEQVWAAIGR